MDIKKYIESGILEQYVLGLLTVEQQQEVEAKAQEYPAIKDEIDQIEDALELYGEANAINPPPRLETAILSKIDLPSNKVSSQQGAKQSSLQKYLGIGLLAAASVAAIVWAFSLNNTLDTTQLKLQQVQNDYQKLEQNCALERQRKEEAEIILALYKNPDTRPVQLSGTPKAPEAIASVLWNPVTQESFLEVSNLPPIADATKQYQLWAIVDGTPVDMGVFDLAIDNDSFLEVPFIETPQAFAITLENKGGSTNPTLEEMVVIGNVS